MSSHIEGSALYPGSFDPPTNGHQWVMERVAEYDKGYVAIGINPDKKGRFSFSEREEMLKEMARAHPNLSVTSFNGLYQVDFAEMLGAKYIIRGARNSTDFGYESDIHHVNRSINPKIETVFFLPPKELLQISSSMVMGLVGFEGWEDEVIHMVPLPVFNRIEAMQQRIDIEQLGKKWNALCERIEAKSNQTLVFQDLIKRYREDHRKYHTLQHIKTCLNEFEIARFLAQQPDALMTALFFHDGIYEGNKNQPGNKFDDEGNSAEYARIVLTKQLGVSSNFADIVTSLIINTKHTSVPTNPDGKLIVDIDLAILGRSQRLFDRYERLIREEYSQVSESDFAVGRVKIISKFLPPHRPTIYQTPFFQKRYEQQAINNLNRSIANLTRAK